MIHKLELPKFGKFINRSFQLKKVTVFYGKNEAGKTTLFDSIYSSLFKMSGTSADKKYFNKRYGENNVASILDLNGHTVKKDLVNFEEFRTLFSIRAGDVSLELNGDSRKKDDWLTEMKSNLLSGGVDLAKIIKEINSINATRVNAPVNAQLKKLETRLEELDKSLQLDKSTRKEQLDSEDEIKSKELLLTELKNKIQQADAELVKIKDKISIEAKIREKKKLLQLLVQLSDLEKKKSYLKDNQLYKNNSVNELDELAAQKQKVMNETEIDVNTVNSIEKEIRLLKENLVALQEKMLGREKIKNLVLAKKGLIKNFIESQTAASGVNGAAIAGFVFFAISLVSALAGFINQWNPVYYISISVLLLAAGIYFLFIKRKASSSNSNAGDELKKHRLAWKIETGESLDEFDSLFDLRDFYIKVENDFNQLEEKIREEKQKINQLESELDKIKYKVKKNQELLESVTRQIQDWLTNNRVANRDEYIEKINQYKNIQKSVDEVVLAFNNQATLEENKLETEFKLKQLAEENLPETASSDFEVNELKSKSAAIEKDISRLKENYSESDKLLEGQRQRLNVEAESVLEKIMKNEKEKIQVIKDINEIYTRKEGAKLAEDILVNLNRDMTRVLVDLSEEIAGEVSKILGERTVDIKDLQQDNFKLQDASGIMQDVDSLSNGTKDIFLFVLKLAFIKKNNRDLKLLLLDEPFLALDRERQKKCLVYLNEFQKETGFQIIFLTKEDFLKEDIEEVFPEMELHNL